MIRTVVAVLVTLTNVGFVVSTDRCNCIQISPESIVVEIDTFSEFFVRSGNASLKEREFRLSMPEKGVIELNKTSEVFASNSTGPISVGFHAIAIRSDFCVEVNDSDLERLCPQSKSVDGMNFDFLAFNIAGFLYYALFNCAFYFISEIQRQYYVIFPRGINPVRLNDVVFSVHAFAVSLITLFQCFIYKRGKQRVSLTGYVLTGLSIGIALITLVFTLASVMSWLTFVLCLSYQKLILTIIKYIPQIYQNYKRKSTVGWSIEQILLDFVGGIASILQMIVLAYNHDDWVHIFGDFTKFGLGLISLLFDIGFIVQHYVLYRPVATMNLDMQLGPVKM